MATRSSILSWRIPWTEEPGGYIQSGLREWDVTEPLITLINWRSHLTSFRMLNFTKEEFSIKSMSRQDCRVTAQVLVLILVSNLAVYLAFSS